MDDLVGWTRARPIRVAFLVEDCKNSSEILDGIFADCYSRWGGRFSLVVPCVAGKVMLAYWPWLERFGPDIIYSYVALSEQDVLELYERVAPSEYILHKFSIDGRSDVFGYKPQFEPRPLSSLSLIFKLARFAPVPPSGAPIKIIESWHTETPSRLLTDNFGVYHYSTGGSILPTDARVAASLISVVSPQYKEDRRYGVPLDMLTVPSEVEVYEKFADRSASALSVISAQFAPRLEFYLPRWNSSFNLVLGESYSDRLLFWNARLLSQAWLDSDIGALRVTSTALEDEKFLAAIGRILRERNHFGGNGHANVTIRSTSVNEDELNEVVQRIKSVRLWGKITAETIPDLASIVPPPKAFRHAAERTHTDRPFFRAPEWTQFSWSEPVAHPPTKIPEHLQDAPRAQAFTQDYWCADFSLQYGGVEIRFAQNVWSLPAKWRLASAFQFSHTGGIGPTGWSPRG